MMMATIMTMVLCCPCTMDMSMMPHHRTMSLSNELCVTKLTLESVCPLLGVPPGHILSVTGIGPNGTHGSLIFLLALYFPTIVNIKYNVDTIAEHLNTTNPDLTLINYAMF